MYLRTRHHFFSSTEPPQFPFLSVVIISYIYIFVQKRGGRVID